MRSPELQLRCRGHTEALAAGATFHVKAAEVYRDAPDGLLELIRQDIEAGQPWREVVRRRTERENPWLARIVTEPARSRWLDLNPPGASSWVLDVGSGWGQWTVPAARTARVVSLEPNPARLAVIRAIARQEGCADRIYFIGARLEEIELPQTKFDQIFCIGVLEWVPQFQTGADPVDLQREFLRRLRPLLRSGGSCVIGIENRLGLKYLLGARDDHTGLVRISCLDRHQASAAYQAKTGRPLRVFTHSLPEYETLLREAGFNRVRFFGAFPDYKLPELILPIEDGSVDRFFAGGGSVREHHGDNGEDLAFQDSLNSNYRRLAATGMAGQHSPSVYIVAATE